MLDRTRLSRRGFVGGVATAVGYLTLKSPMELMAHERAALGLSPHSPVARTTISSRTSRSTRIHTARPNR